MSTTTSFAPRLASTVQWRAKVRKVIALLSTTASVFSEGLHACRRYHQLTMRGLPADVAARRVFEDLYSTK